MMILFRVQKEVTEIRRPTLCSRSARCQAKSFVFASGGDIHDVRIAAMFWLFPLEARERRSCGREGLAVVLLRTSIGAVYTQRHIIRDPRYGVYLDVWSARNVKRKRRWR